MEKTEIKTQFNREEKTLTIGEKVFKGVKWFHEYKTTYRIQKENNKYDIFSKDNLKNPIFKDAENFHEYETTYRIEKENYKYDVFLKDNLKNPIFKDVKWFYEYITTYKVQTENNIEIINKEKFINNLKNN